MQPFIQDSASSHNLAQVNAEIALLCQRYQRPPSAVQLLAVSKSQSASAIRQVCAAGQYAFGENYLQEALLKIVQLQDLPLQWHYIGALQSNKTKKIAAHFSWVHTVAKPAIAARLAQHRPANLPPLNILIQVNSSAEPQKAGCLVNEVSALAEYCRGNARLRLRGLMILPKIEHTLLEQRQSMQQMQQLWLEIGANHPEFDTLSMGTSADLEAALAEGSTLLRIGTKIFGARA